MLCSSEFSLAIERLLVNSVHCRVYMLFYTYLLVSYCLSYIDTVHKCVDSMLDMHTSAYIAQLSGRENADNAGQDTEWLC